MGGAEQSTQTRAERGAERPRWRAHGVHAKIAPLCGVGTSESTKGPAVGDPPLWFCVYRCRYAKPEDRRAGGAWRCL